MSNIETYADLIREFPALAIAARYDIELALLTAYRIGRIDGAMQELNRQVERAEDLDLPFRELTGRA